MHTQTHTCAHRHTHAYTNTLHIDNCVIYIIADTLQKQSGYITLKSPSVNFCLRTKIVVLCDYHNICTNFQLDNKLYSYKNIKNALAKM